MTRTWLDYDSGVAATALKVVLATRVELAEAAAAAVAATVAAAEAVVVLVIVVVVS